MSYCPVLDSNQYHSYPKGILTTWTTGTYGAKGGTWTRTSFTHQILSLARLPFRHSRIIEALGQLTAHLLIAGIFAFPISHFACRYFTGLASTGMRAFF